MIPHSSIPTMNSEEGVEPAAPLWYAVWTRSRGEKAAAKILASLEIPHFLPLRSELHQWSDRTKVVQTPLFAGYLFVLLGGAQDKKLQVLKTPGIVGFVGNQTGPLPIPSQQIEDIRKIIEMDIDCDVIPLFKQGDRVRVMRGPLIGLEGTLSYFKSVARLVVSIEAIHQCLALNVSISDVELVNETKPLNFEPSHQAITTPYEPSPAVYQ
jgi:transcription antitermination factor NusG